METEPKLVPGQETGAKSETTFAVKARSREDAIMLFRKARQRLLNINQWHQFCKGISAEFRLTDEKGFEVNRQPQLGDHFRIEIPEPAKGPDWVQIEALEDKTDKYGNQEVTSIRV